MPQVLHVPPLQDVPALQVSAPQQGWLTFPHGLHEPDVHTRLSAHTPPSQHASLASPHATQTPPVPLSSQTMSVPQASPLVQHGSPNAPQ